MYQTGQQVLKCCGGCSSLEHARIPSLSACFALFELLFSCTCSTCSWILSRYRVKTWHPGRAPQIGFPTTKPLIRLFWVSRISLGSPWKSQIRMLLSRGSFKAHSLLGTSKAAHEPLISCLFYTYLPPVCMSLWMAHRCFPDVSLPSSQVASLLNKPIFPFHQNK